MPSKQERRDLPARMALVPLAERQEGRPTGRGVSPERECPDHPEHHGQRQGGRRQLGVLAGAQQAQRTDGRNQREWDEADDVRPGLVVPEHIENVPPGDLTPGIPSSPEGERVAQMNMAVDDVHPDDDEGQSERQERGAGEETAETALAQLGGEQAGPQQHGKVA